MVGYFTAGIMLLLGVLLIVKYGRELKLCYIAGGVFLLLGVWWALNTLFEKDPTLHPIFDGWLGWVVKCIAGAALVGMALYFFVHRKREVDAFKASKEPPKKAERTTLYEQYDDYKYDDDKEPGSNDGETSQTKR